MVLLYPNGRPRERSITLPTVRRMVSHSVSCIPNELYPWDPTVVGAIRAEFDPTFIPVFVRNVYKTSTGGFEVEQHHAAAAATPLAERTQPIDPMTYRSLQPTYGPRRTERPTRIHLHFYHRDQKQRRSKGVMVPFEWNVYWFLRTMRNEMCGQELREYLEAHSEQSEAAKAVALADERARYQERADSGYLARQIEALDVTDRRRLAAKGLHYDPNPATRPSVYVGRSTT